MAKFYGTVGYAESEETAVGSGIWTDNIVEISHFGDVVRSTRKLESGESLNDNIVVSNSISIIANEYAITNFSKIKYVRWAGVLWTVTSVEIQRPRLILNLGEVYNGPTD